MEVWNEYIQFSLAGIDEEGGIENCRQIFERAINSVGLHFSMGNTIWNSYRDFEARISKTDGQKSNYISVCCRQLAVPLRQMENTFQCLKAAIEIDKDTEKSYYTALEKLKVLEKWERHLVSNRFLTLIFGNIWFHWLNQVGPSLRPDVN